MRTLKVGLSNGKYFSYDLRPEDEFAYNLSMAGTFINIKNPREISGDLQNYAKEILNSQTKDSSSIVSVVLVSNETVIFTVSDMVGGDISTGIATSNLGLDAVGNEFLNIKGL